MKIKTVWAVYFSGTGTTEKIVTTIAAAAAEQLHAPYNTLDFTLPASREHSYHFSTGDLVIFGTPVIAGRVPNVLLPFLTGHIQAEGALAVPVVLFGNRNYDDALMELREILEGMGSAPSLALPSSGNTLSRKRWPPDGQMRTICPKPLTLPSGLRQKRILSRHCLQNRFM